MKICPSCGHVVGRVKYPDLVPAGAVIRELRLERGMTQADLAARMGRSHVAVHFLETGNVRLTFRQLMAVAGGLDMTTADLVARMDAAGHGE